MTSRFRRSYLLYLIPVAAFINILYMSHTSLPNDSLDGPPADKVQQKRRTEKLMQFQRAVMLEPADGRSMLDVALDPEFRELRPDSLKRAYEQSINEPKGGDSDGLLEAHAKPLDEDDSGDLLRAHAKPLDEPNGDDSDDLLRAHAKQLDEPNGDDSDGPVRQDTNQNRSRNQQNVNPQLMQVEESKPSKNNKCPNDPVIPKTFWVPAGPYTNRYVAERLHQLGWKGREPDPSTQFIMGNKHIYASFEKLESRTKPGCTPKIRLMRKSTIVGKINNKSRLPGALKKHHMETGADISFIPKTWHMDAIPELIDFFQTIPCEKQEDKLYIFKRSNSARGNSIYLEDDPVIIRQRYHTDATKEYDECKWPDKPAPELPHDRGGFIQHNMDFVNRGFIAQEYITNTLLFDGYKFHLRAYYYAFSLDPLYVVFNDAYLMLAASKFDTKSMKKDKHVSNNSQTKLSNRELQDTHKSLAHLQEYLDQNNLGPPNFVNDSLMEQMVQIGRTCWEAIELELKYQAEFASQGTYTFLATDFVITEDFEVKLIEWERNPGMIAMVNHCDVLPWACELARVMGKELVDTMLQVNERRQKGESFAGLGEGKKYKVVIDSS